MKRINEALRRRLHLLVAVCVALSAVGCTTGGQHGPGATTTGAQPQHTRSNLPYNDNPNVSAADEQRFINGANAFGLDVFRRVTAGGNVVFSPLSLSVAMSMAYAGAAGDTAAQMKSVLRDPFGDDTYFRAVNQLLIALRSRSRGGIFEGDPRSIELSLVDATFTARDLSTRPRFLDILSTQYNAGVHAADFKADAEGERLNINKFVSAATKDLITDLIPRVDPPLIDRNSRAVLVNAAYLKASWRKSFDPKLTADGAFRIAPGSPVTVPMMHDPVRSMPYFSGPDFQAATLPYIGDDLEMMIVLPTEGRLAAVRNSMDDIWMRNVLGSRTDTYVDFRMPKFRVTWGSEIFDQTLIDMGMPTAFDRQRADFSNMSDEQLAISSVLQKAYVGVDELGTVAAATSAVTGGGMGPTPETITLNIDHPFLFAIVDKTGAVLFTGQVTDPR
ncbi:serpin family protein [Mycobacterium sp. TY815]|uniref:serpin family protein n=1 Tax=Mycobacterium sp. TY815 TaxID=3050581 RepID=UPI0027422E1C|nr:serpin family protein [Mycobacterium sp. TY815]MDP7705732.1 serpin family protein [Mycobacterium sp. TY815]